MNTLRTALKIINDNFQKMEQGPKQSNNALAEGPNSDTTPANANDNVSTANNATGIPQTAPPEHVHSMSHTSVQIGT